MKKYTWILGGLMALAITACTGDELMQNPEQQPAEGEVVTVTAFAPGNNTNSRVEFNESTTQGVSFDLSWSNNDKFSVIMNSSYKTFTKVSNSDNLFSGTYPAGSGTYYAVYPYIESGDASATAVPFDLSTQTGELDSDMTYMYASLTNGQTFSFSHCMSILKASFSFTGLTEDATIKQIKVTTPDAYKVNGTINLSNSGTLTGATENGTNDITITIPVVEEPVSQAEGEEAYYIYLPPMTENNVGNTLNFEVTTSDDAVYTGTISRNGAIEAGTLYTATVALEQSISFTSTTLPDGLTFAYQVGEKMKNQDITAFRFVSKSNEMNSATSFDKPGIIPDNVKYIIKTVEGVNTFEIHTAEDFFMFNTDCTQMFSGHYHSTWQQIKSIDFNNSVYTSNVENMNGMFRKCYALLSIDLSSFNTAKVTNMGFMFHDCGKLESFNFGAKFNTQNVTNMSNMFAECDVLESIDLSCFNTQEVTSMEQMFYKCMKLASLKLGKDFYVDNNTTIKEMFRRYNSNPQTTLILDLTECTINAENATGIISMIDTGHNDSRIYFIKVKVTPGGYELLKGWSQSASRLIDANGDTYVSPQ